MKRTKEYTEKHLKLMKILEDYGNPEFGDCIIDEICKLFNYKLTPSDEDKT